LKNTGDLVGCVTGTICSIVLLAPRELLISEMAVDKI